MEPTFSCGLPKARRSGAGRAPRLALAVSLAFSLAAVPDLALAAAPEGAGRAAAVRVLREGGRPASSPLGLELRSDGRDPLRIRLERNRDLIAPGAKLLLVGEETSETPLVPTTWRGTVDGDPESAVRVSIEGSSVRGYVRTADAVVLIEPAQDGEGHAAIEASELLASAEPSPCAAETEPLPLAPLRSARSATSPSLRQLEVSVVADSAFWGRFGERSGDYLQELFNQVDGIYRRDFGLAVQIRQMVIYTSAAAQPFPTSDATAQEILGNLSIARSSTEAFAIGAGGVTHLVVGGSLGGPLGIAWIGGACDPLWGASLSRIQSRPGYLETLLVAHEIGHNMGALHDGQAGSACESVPAGWIMWPTLYTGLDDSFSACSAATISGRLATSTCLGEATPALCGNGVLDPGEQCDEGSGGRGGCCRTNCTFELAGMPCSGPDELCWDDVCDGAGTCTMVANSEPCVSGDTCMAAHCSGGECLATEKPRPLFPIRAKFRVGGDGMLGDGLFTASTATAGPYTDPASDGFTLDIRVDGEAIFGQFVPPGHWLRKKAGKFLYKDTSAAPGTIVSAKMSIRSDGDVTYKVRLARPMMSVRPARPEFLVVAGDAAEGSCGSGSPSICGMRGSKFVCE